MSSNEKIVYSTTYNDESADITLISEDNVTFKVFSYEMKAHSSVLRDLLQEPKLDPTPIPIDINASDLTLFLDYMLKYPAPDIPDWTTAKRTFSLADKWGCNIVHERLILRLFGIAGSAPWDIFCFASHDNNLELARKALGEMHRDTNRSTLSLGSMSSSDAASPSISYLMGLVHQLARYENYYEKDWTKISKEFTPRK